MQSFYLEACITHNLVIRGPFTHCADTCLRYERSASASSLIFHDLDKLISDLIVGTPLRDTNSVHSALAHRLQLTTFGIIKVNVKRVVLSMPTAETRYKYNA